MEPLLVAAFLVAILVLPRGYSLLVGLLADRVIAPLTARTVGVTTEEITRPDHLMRAHAAEMCEAIVRVFGSMQASDGGRSGIAALEALREVADKTATVPSFFGEDQRRWEQYVALVSTALNRVRAWIVALGDGDRDASVAAFERVKETVARLELIARSQVATQGGKSLPSVGSK